jgi:hypothetical protein
MCDQGTSASVSCPLHRRCKRVYVLSCMRAGRCIYSYGYIHPTGIMSANCAQPRSSKRQAPVPAKQTPVRVVCVTPEEDDAVWSMMGESMTDEQVQVPLLKPSTGTWAHWWALEKQPGFWDAFWKRKCIVTSPPGLQTLSFLLSQAALSPTPSSSPALRFDLPPAPPPSPASRFDLPQDGLLADQPDSMVVCDPVDIPLDDLLF